MAKPRLKQKLFISSNIDHIDQMKFMTEEIQSILERRGYSLTPYTSDSLQKFSEDPEEKQIASLEEVRNYLEIIKLKPILENTGKLRNQEEVKILRIFFDKYNVLAPTEVFREIKEGNVIEVYTEDHRQIHRNFEFLHECKYDYLTTIRNPWYEIYDRDNEIQNQILSQVEVFIRGPRVYSSIDPKIPAHTVKELKLENVKRRYLIKMRRWIKVPCTKNKECFIIVISKTKRIKI